MFRANKLSDSPFKFGNLRAGGQPVRLQNVNDGCDVIIVDLLPTVGNHPAATPLACPVFCSSSG
jgi:hypothetical protein